VVFRRILGESSEVADMSLEQLFQWGQALGQLHKLSQAYTPLGPARLSWEEQLNWAE